MLRTTHDARRTMSSELTHARRQLYERGDHKLRDLAVRLPFLIEDVRHLKSRAHVGWKVGVHRKLRLRLPAVHIGHTRRLLVHRFRAPIAKPGAEIRHQATE